ncbi:LysR substrate-binding domain-containing protein [Aliiruegeria lutimaris]|uniref:LysR substrate-binding domain-containing protein n=1 Tax=Aliiruegeria lutimaris TaxID=571298 RepID=UPI00147DBE30|nr:LysR substrate-binding domain-containing protein [Aliiruegeria lutimaris]
MGCSQALASYFLPEQIATYQALFPRVSFEVEVLEHGAAAAALESYIIDLAIVFDQGKPPDYKILAGVPQTLSAVMDEAHPLARKDRLRLRQCFEYPVLLPARGFGGRRLIDNALVGKTFAVPPVIESNSFEYLKAHVAATEAITFQIEIGAPDITGTKGIVNRPIDRRDVGSGNLWVGQGVERTLSVASSRFAEQVIKELSERYGMR